MSLQHVTGVARTPKDVRWEKASARCRVRWNCYMSSTSLIKAKFASAKTASSPLIEAETDGLLLYPSLPPQLKGKECQSGPKSHF